MGQPGSFHMLDVGAGVQALAWSADSARIAAGGDGTTAVVYSVAGGDPVARIPVSRTASVAFSPVGQTVGVADAEQVAVHRVSDGSEMWSATVLAGESVNTVTFSPDGTLVLAATDTSPSFQ